MQESFFFFFSLRKGQPAGGGFTSCAETLIIMMFQPFHSLLVNKIPPGIPQSVFSPPSFKRNMLLTCQSVLTVCDRPPATERIHYSCTLTSVPITLTAVSKAALFGRLARGRQESREAQRGRQVFRTITVYLHPLRCLSERVLLHRQSWKSFFPFVFAKAPLK